MVTRVEHRSKSEAFIWSLVVILVTASVVSNYYFHLQSNFVKVSAGLVVCAVAAFLVSRTTFGCGAITLWQEAVVELRKVIWPNRKETSQTTMAVVAMVFVMCILLWGIDAVLIRVIGALLGHGGV